MPPARCYYSRAERLLGPKAPKSSASQVTSQLGQRSTGRGTGHGVREGSTCFSGRGPRESQGTSGSQVGSSIWGGVLSLLPPPEPHSPCKERPPPPAAASPQEGDKSKLGLGH